jgi:tight adherence protein C
MGANLYPALLGLASFFGVLAVLALLIWFLNSGNERRIRRRLEGNDGPGTDDFADAGQRPVMQSLARRGRALDQLVDNSGETQRLLIQAGWRDTQSRLGYYVLQAVSPVLLVGLVVAGWIFVKGRAFEPPLVWLLLVAALILSILVPRMVLRSIATSRRERIAKEVPLFVHMLVMLYDAGLSTRQAFANLVREGGGVLPELGGEINLVLRQIEAGADSSEALLSLSESLEVDDLTSILGVMRQVDRYGGEIREPLQDALKVVEERRALDLREKVNLISGRMTVVMVAFFFPGLLVFVAGPALTAIIKALQSL